MLKDLGDFRSVPMDLVNQIKVFLKKGNNDLNLRGTIYIPEEVIFSLESLGYYELYHTFENGVLWYSMICDKENVVTVIANIWDFNLKVIHGEVQTNERK